MENDVPIPIQAQQKIACCIKAAKLLFLERLLNKTAVKTLQ
jgi:hypothetical protein